MRTPPHIPSAVLEDATDEYIREVRRLRRAEMRAAITKRCEADGSPVLTEDEIETSVDILEALIQVAGHDPDTINHLIDELACSSDGTLAADQVLLSLERRMRPRPPLIDDATLDQYHFEGTGKLFTRCTRCRRGHHVTEQQFRYNRFLQRMLIQPPPCPYCHTGQVKLYGVKAVLRDNAPSEACHEPSKPQPRKRKRRTTRQSSR